MMRMCGYFVLAFGLMLGCASNSKRPDGSLPDSGGDNNATTCETCLASGGTWQPEVAECTRGCAIQDISCFRDDCPAPCSKDNCGGCFSTTTCEAAGCQWRQEEEAMWCTR